jgi:sugar phosphate permease
MNAAGPPGLVWRVLLPFAFAYVLSYLYRSVNAVIAPDLVAAFDLSATQLGLLTSAYLLAFAAFQLPLGLLLDRFGPRRTDAVCCWLRPPAQLCSPRPTDAPTSRWGGR